MTTPQTVPYETMYAVVAALGALQHAMASLALGEKPDSPILAVLERNMDYLIDTVFDGEVGVARPDAALKTVQ